MVDAATTNPIPGLTPTDGGGAVIVDAGMDGALKPTVPERWIVGGWISTTDNYTGYLTVVNDLSASGRVDLSQVVEFAGDIVYASPGGGVVYVGLADKPVIERWTVTAENKLKKDGDISFAKYGVTKTLGGGRNVIQFIGAERAYYFDNENLQVIVFNPARMETVEAFSIKGMDQAGQEMALNFIHKDGNRFIITARYWSLADETTTPLVRAAIIDSTNNAVTYTDDTRCGNIAFQVTDSAGNLYFGSHPGLAVSIAAGTAGGNPPKPCLLRINKGQSVFDQSYFVDLTQVASGGVVGGLLQGSENTAYVFQYTGPGITKENERPTLRGEAWALFSLKLGDERNSYAKVEATGAVTPYGSSFSTIVNGRVTPYVVGVKADFSAGRYFDVSDPRNVKQALMFPSYPGHAHAVH
jgi:hypothetical protein